MQTRRLKICLLLCPPSTYLTEPSDERDSRCLSHSFESVALLSHPIGTLFRKEWCKTDPRRRVALWGTNRLRVIRHVDVLYRHGPPLIDASSSTETVSSEDRQGQLGRAAPSWVGSGRATGR